jgi:RNA polymerase sigma-70 factor (ECF subfamily)
MASRYHDRAVHRREVLTTAENFFEKEDVAPGTDEELEQEEARLRLIELLQRVDPKLRHVLVAHDFDHIPMREVAKQLGISVNTAYKWRARTIAALAGEIHRMDLEKADKKCKRFFGCQEISDRPGSDGSR